MIIIDKKLYTIFLLFTVKLINNSIVIRCGLEEFVVDLRWVVSFFEETDSGGRSFLVLIWDTPKFTVVDHLSLKVWQI